MSSRTLAVLLSLGAVVAGGCTAPEQSLSPAEPVVVGVLVDSSQAEAAGADAVRGGELAAELVNGSYPELGVPLAAAAGLPGLGGAQLVVEVAETGGDPDAAEAATGQRLAGGQVAGLVVADSADVVAVAAAYATRQGVAMVDVATSAEFLLDLGLEWYFRTGPTDRTLAEAGFALLAADPPSGDSRAAVVLTAASESGPAAASQVPGLARAAGFPVADTIEVQGAGDIDAALRLAQATPAVAVAVAESEAGARQLRGLLAELDSPPPVVELGAGYREPADGLAGAVRPVGWSDELAARHPLAQAVSGLYEQRFGQPMTGPAAAGFTGVMTLAAAANAAGTGDPAAVRVALRQLDLPATQLVMPWRGIQFGANGQNESAAVVAEQRHGQQWQVVFPPELAAGPVDWPTPPEQETGL
jgi:branched-chain amino acid transport system substrate-binding protein